MFLPIVIVQYRFAISAEQVEACYVVFKSQGLIPPEVITSPLKFTYTLKFSGIEF